MPLLCLRRWRRFRAGLLLLCLAADGCLLLKGADKPPGHGSIEGHVVNAATGAFMRGAYVRLKGSDADLLAETAVDGTFHFTGLPAGTFRVTAKRGGYMERSPVRVVSLNDQEEVRDADLRLFPQASLSGRVLDEVGEPVEGARVLLRRQAYQHGEKRWQAAGGQATTDDRGQFRFRGLDPGKYIAVADRDVPAVNSQYGEEPSAYYRSTYYPNVRNQADASLVELEVGAEVDGIDITLVKEPRREKIRISGEISGIPALPGTSVGVTATPNDDDISYYGIPSGESSYSVNLPPGTYKLVGYATGSGAMLAQGTRAVTATGNLAGITLNLQPTPEVSGRVVLKGSVRNQSAEGIQVALWSLATPQRAPTPATCDAAGRFRLPGRLLPGKQFLGVAAGPKTGKFFVERVRLNGVDMPLPVFEVESSGELEITLNPEAASLQATVTGNDDKPVPHATVICIADDGKSLPLKVEANDSG